MRSATVAKQKIVERLKARKTNRKYVLYIDGGMIQSKPTGEKPTDYGYSTAMNHLISKKGGEAADYEELMNIIAFHETGAQQRMKPDAIQLIENEKGELVPQGVGRGLFMFEAGDGAGGITAVNRTYKEFKDNNIEIPSWLEELYKEKSLDASTLSAEQQKVLFIGNYLQHPKANLGAWREGKVSTEEFWGNYHHAGGDSTNYDSFRASEKAYQESKKK